MKREVVVSSNVAAIGYNPETLVLEVAYKANRNGESAVWQYPGISHDAYAKIVAAPSVGVAIRAVQVLHGFLGRRVAVIDRDGIEHGIDVDEVPA